jgi:predicted cupin superfamily sugar epimerase
MMVSAEDLIKMFDLKRHPEGGYFAETYRSSESIPRGALPSRYRGDRNISSAIYFLLPAGTVSRLHRIASDEVWHFYLGGPLEILQIPPSGELGKVILGPDVLAQQKLQHVVSAGHWFCARPVEGSGYSFVGCTVAPGFDFKDFEIADPEDLVRRFPELKREIQTFQT